MRLAVAARDDGADQRSPDGLVVGPAEDLFSLAVPAGDQAALVGGDHGAGRGVDDHLQPLLRFAELLHHPQLDLRVAARSGMHAEGGREQRRTGKEEQRVPHVPEAVVAGSGEEKDQRLD